MKKEKEKKPQKKKDNSHLPLKERIIKNVIENDPLKQKKIKDISKGYRK